MLSATSFSTSSCEVAILFDVTRVCELMLLTTLHEVIQATETTHNVVVDANVDILINDLRQLACSVRCSK